MRKKKCIPIFFMMAFALLLSIFGVKPITKAYAAEVGPDILITEIMPESRSTEDGYEYIELYNNTDDNIDIENYKFVYPEVDITAHKIIPPHGVIILCTRGATTLSSFNSFYGTSLESSKFVSLPLSYNALSNTSDQCVILCEDDGNIVVCANYDISDIAAKKSITYKYPEDGFFMDMLAKKQAPTIGTVSNEQTPYNNAKVTGITLNRSSLTIETDETYRLKASITPSNAANKSIKWSSSDEDIAYVDKYGLVYGEDEGRAVITAKTVDGGFKATCKVTVTDKDEGHHQVNNVIISRLFLIMKEGDKEKLTVAVFPSKASNKDVIWSSDNTSTAKVDDDGNVTAVGRGIAVITVKTEEGNHSARCIVIVLNEYIKYKDIFSIKLNNKTLKISEGQTFRLNVMLMPWNARKTDLKWSSSNSKIVSVSDDGKITGLKNGKATITVSTKDGEHEDSCVVYVEKAKGNRKYKFNWKWHF
jgi:uncharacterized protein YjdB